MNNKEDNKFIMCDCQSHALYIEVVEDMPQNKTLYINVFERHIDGRKMSFFERIRWCYYILKNGHPFTDMIILNGEKSNELKKFLNYHF